MTTNVVVLMPRPNRAGKRVKVSVVQVSSSAEQVIDEFILEHGQSTEMPLYVYGGRYIRIEEVSG